MAREDLAEGKGTRYRRLGAIVIALVFASCGGSSTSNDAGQADATNGPDTEAPIFDGLIHSVAPSPTSAQLQWLAASDDGTPADEMTYDIYLANDPVELASVETLNPYLSVTGGTEAILEGLNADSSYYLVAVAQDNAGNRSTSLRAPLAVYTPTTPLVPRSAVSDLRELSSALGASEYSLSSGESVSVGDIVMVNNPGGRLLQEVVAVNAAASPMTFTTTAASMTDLIEEGTIRSQVVLPNTLDTSSSNLAASYRTPVAVRTTAAPGTIFLTKTGSKIGATTELSANSNLDWSLSFEPVLETEMAWGGNEILPERVKVLGSGTFALNATAGFNFSASAKQNIKKELFSRTIVLTYSIGAVPVYQEATITMFAELDLSVEGSFSGSSTYSAEKEIQLGFQWQAGAGFELLKDEGFTQEIDVSLDGQATAKGQLKIYPVLSTSFYKSALILLFVEPTLDWQAKARFVPTPVELEQFDMKFFVEAQVQANMSIFSLIIPEWKSDRYRLLEIPIHSLPDIGILGASSYLDTCGSRTLFLKVSDGYNNKLDPGSITWQVEETGGTIVPAGSGLSAEFSASIAGTYTIRVSAFGDGFLGSLGTRYTTLSLTVAEAPMDDCDPANSDVPPGSALFTCMDNGAGLYAPIVFSANTVGVNEVFSTEFPFYCAWEPCYVGAAIALPEQGGTTKPLLGTSGFPQTFVGPVEEGFTVTNSVFAGFDVPGAYQLGMSISDGVFPLDTKTNYRLGNSPGWEVYQETPDSDCTNSSGLAVPTIRYVADDGRDGNDTPEDAELVSLRGEGSVHRVQSQFTKSQDVDWYEVSLDEPEAVYDSDIAYTDGCDTVVFSESLQGSPMGALRIFPDRDAASAGFPILAQGNNRLVVPSDAPRRFYIEASNGFSTDSYALGAQSDCSNAWSQHPGLLAAPLPVSAEVTAGDAVVVRFELTANAKSIVARLYNPELPLPEVAFWTRIEVTNPSQTDLTLQTVAAGGGQYGDYVLEFRIDTGFSTSPWWQTSYFSGDAQVPYYEEVRRKSPGPTQTGVGVTEKVIIAVVAP